MKLDIAFSPCPNDTFIFHALIHQLIDVTPYGLMPFIADVEELNLRAFSETHAVTKISFGAYLKLKDRYILLDSGSALGFGCGPLLVAKEGCKSLEKACIAVPGRYTTAFLLLQLWHPGLTNFAFVRFDEILPGIAAGRFDAGLIIHEGRFVYPSYHCTQIVDLGQWWESQTGLPIPLGCIAIRQDSLAYQSAMEDLIRESIEYARRNPSASHDFIKMHAQELDDEVIRLHIALYVNEFSFSLGEKGRQALITLEEKARCHGIL
jgi:1,4-dihydroxy-6-naphthoate synthase